MRSLIHLIMLVDLLLLGVIHRPSPTQAAPTLPAPSIKSLPSLDKALIGPDCVLFPSTIRQNQIDEATPGVSVIDILGGYPDISGASPNQPGTNDRGFLAWNPQWNNATDLRFELQNLQLSLSDYYTNARNLNDHLLNVGDYVTSLLGNNGSAQYDIELLIGQELIIPVWDGFQYSLSSNMPAAFHISSFARVRIRDDDPYAINLLSNNPQVFATYLGPVDLVQCPYLTLAKSGPPTAAVNSPITYTLTLTNSGNLSATNLVITDAVPANATYLDGGTLVGNVVSWTVPSLAVGSSLTRTFSVTATQTITNNDYRVSSAEEVSATGTVTVVTNIAPELTIIKTGPSSAPANSPITYTLQVHNNGGLATNLTLTDTLPTGATYVSGGTLIGNVISWTIPSLPFGSSLPRTFSVTASQTITNSDYRISGDGDIGATGTVSVVTSVTVDNHEPVRIYLPAILKNL